VGKTNALYAGGPVYKSRPVADWVGVSCFGNGFRSYPCFVSLWRV